MQETMILGFDGPVVVKLGLRTTAGDQFYNIWKNGEMLAVVGSNRLTPIQKLIARKNTFSQQSFD